MNLTRENKGLWHTLEGMQEQCRFHKEIMLLKEKQLSLKKKIAKKWLKTEEGKMLMAWLGANNISQDMRV